MIHDAELSRMAAQLDMAPFELVGGWFLADVRVGGPTHGTKRSIETEWVASR